MQQFTLIAGVAISPNTPESDDDLTQEALASYHGKSIGPHQILHLWRETGNVCNANGTRYTFGFRALVSGRMVIDRETDNVTPLVDIDVTLAPGITFHTMQTLHTFSIGSAP